MVSSGFLPIFLLQNTIHKCPFLLPPLLSPLYLTQAAVAVPGSSITQFLLGRFYQNSNNFYYVGDLASTYLFNRELTETEIKDTFNIQRGRFGV